MPAEALTGHVDPLGRPLIQLPLIETADPLLALVDTGFNGALIFNSRVLAQSLKFTVSDSTVRAELGDGTPTSFLAAFGTVRRFGEARVVTALVPPSNVPERGAARSRVAVTIGTELLLTCRLQIDFPKRMVTIGTGFQR